MIDSEGASHGGFAYLRSDGAAHMVDATTKEPTVHEATAVAHVECFGTAMVRLSEDSVPKEDVLTVARVAGIQAAKKTPALLLLAHVVSLHGCEVGMELVDGGVVAHATARTADRAGVEMEALTTVTVAAPTVVDMVRGIDRSVMVAGAKIAAESGRRSRSWIWSEG